ncbi:hypothetical protein CF319_g8581 [Tilletia indica]|nr:hypothetical protein CF319_g8581 [Tilletia indica]
MNLYVYKRRADGINLFDLQTQPTVIAPSSTSLQAYSSGTQAIAGCFSPASLISQARSLMELGFTVAIDLRVHQQTIREAFMREQSRHRLLQRRRSLPLRRHRRPRQR